MKDQIQQVRDGNRDIDDVDTDFDEWVEKVIVKEDGSIVIASDQKTILYNSNEKK